MKSRSASLLPVEARALPPLPRSFYLDNTVQVARALLGKGLYVRGSLVEIVEVEAYLAGEDPASHAFRGPTKRSSQMFEEGGSCYVYLSYGINYCMNVVTMGKGTGHAVLLRAGAPVLGEAAMLARRPKCGSGDYRMLNGPGKLTQALGVGLGDNGRHFFEPRFKIVDLGSTISNNQIVSSPRVGISKARELPLRFFLRDSPWVSKTSRKG